MTFAKMSSLSNPMESFKLSSCCFLAAASFTDELSFFSIEGFGNIHVVTKKYKDLLNIQ